MEDYAAKFEEIRALVAAQTEAEFDYCLRDALEERLIEELFAQTPEEEQDALYEAAQAYRDRQQDKAIVELGEHCEANGLTLVAATHPDELERMADLWPNQASQTVRGLRESARERRAASAQHRRPAPARLKSLSAESPRCVPRARGRRERRVARASSSSDSGDSGEPPGGGDEPPPAPPQLNLGLATCPLCCDERAFRPCCSLCRGLGFVERELRNRWKRGWRP